jgi:hypothetical protein
MRLREVLIGIALMFFTLITGKAIPSLNAEGKHSLDSPGDNATEANRTPVVLAESSALIYQDKVLGTAYYNTLTILSTANACSDFFGGSEASVDVFNRLMRKVRKEHLSSSIGMRMTGQTTTVLNAATKNSYRLFDEVTINANGPFYKKSFSHSEPAVPRIGTFEPNTKEVRVLILLHELGHLIKGEQGEWLLPNDGKDEQVSRLNSRKIEDVCGEQIRKLGKSAAADPAGRKTDEQVASIAPETPQEYAE